MSLILAPHIFTDIKKSTENTEETTPMWIRKKKKEKEKTFPKS
jgi:hypothetical protein